VVDGRRRRIRRITTRKTTSRGKKECVKIRGIRKWGRRIRRKRRKIRKENCAKSFPKCSQKRLALIKTVSRPLSTTEIRV
jgi:hypothetical protein